MASAILYQNTTRTITVIDIPKSIELAQGSAGRRLLSTEPLPEPFPSLEPKSHKALSKLVEGEHSIDELLIQRSLELSLAEIREGILGNWFLPRVVPEPNSTESECSPRSKSRRKHEAGVLEKGRPSKGKPQPLATCNHSNSSSSESPETMLCTIEFLVQSPSESSMEIHYQLNKLKAYIPPGCTALLGNILATRTTFIHHAPKFDLIIMDPPWPNRSARRKGGYGISYNTSEIRSLLSSLPIQDHLTDEGYVAVWITNKPIFRELAIELFTDLGLTLVEEWIWLKITGNGEPIYALNGSWRKPYEIMLVGRKHQEEQAVDVTRRVLVGAPDVHSRKPNLKALLELMIGKKSGEYEALEIFARNLTEGWWGWGDEVLKFQEAEYWLDSAAAEPADGGDRLDSQPSVPK